MQQAFHKLMGNDDLVKRTVYRHPGKTHDAPTLVSADEYCTEIPSFFNELEGIRAGCIPSQDRSSTSVTNIFMSASHHAYVLYSIRRQEKFEIGCSAPIGYAYTEEVSVVGNQSDVEALEQIISRHLQTESSK